MFLILIFPLNWEQRTEVGREVSSSTGRTRENDCLNDKEREEVGNRNQREKQQQFSDQSRYTSYQTKERDLGREQLGIERRKREAEGHDLSSKKSSIEGKGKAEKNTS